MLPLNSISSALYVTVLKVYTDILDVNYYAFEQA